MKEFAKKSVALLLAACFVLTSLPASALAEESYEEYLDPYIYEYQDSAEPEAWAAEPIAYEEPAYEEPVYEEPVYEEPVEYVEPAPVEEAYVEPAAVVEPAYEEPVVTEPTYTEPAPTEPTYTEPAPTEPVYTEPAPTEPVYTEPAPTEPVYTEPAPTEPVQTEPAPTQPAATEPAPIEPVYTEPAPTEPVYTEPAPTEPVYTEPAPETQTEIVTEAPTPAPEPEVARSTFFIYEDDNMKVSAQLNDAEALPVEGTALIVKEIFEDSYYKSDRDSYNAAMAGLVNFCNEHNAVILNSFIYDIHFEIDGYYYEPAYPVNILIEYKGEGKPLDSRANNQNYNVVRYDDLNNEFKAYTVSNLSAEIYPNGNLGKTQFLADRSRYWMYSFFVYEDVESYNQRMAEEAAAAEAVTEEETSEEETVLEEETSEEETLAEEETSEPEIIFEEDNEGETEGGNEEEITDGEGEEEASQA